MFFFFHSNCIHQKSICKAAQDYSEDPDKVSKQKVNDSFHGCLYVIVISFQNPEPCKSNSNVKQPDRVFRALSFELLFRFLHNFTVFNINNKITRKASRWH